MVYFGNRAVRLIVLNQNVKILCPTSVHWDWARKQESKLVQYRDSQMFEHGERSCDLKAKCDVYAMKHKTAGCPDSSIVRRANCNQNHVFMDNTVFFISK